MVYITGSNGFIGSHLRNVLHDQKDLVSCIPHEKIPSTKIDDADTFYFLSSYGNMSWQTEDEKIMQANIVDLISVLSNINFSTLRSFIFLSSSSAKRRIQTMYSRAKKSAEEILLAFMEKYNAPICIIRPFSVTGVGEQKEHLIPQLIESCMKDKKIPFVPDPCHDYIDVQDLVRAMLLLSSRKVRGIIEVGTGTSYSNEEVKKIVEDITGKKAKLNVVSHMRSYDSDDWVSTNFRIRTFGWNPEKTLIDSVAEMVQAYDQ